MLELFCGTKSLSKVFDNAGHDTYTVDIDCSFEPDWCEDVNNISAIDIVKKMGFPDLIWASPPCTTFSVASCGKHWTKDKKPKSQACKDNLSLVYHTVELIYELNPSYWFIENPVGMLRKDRLMQNVSENFNHKRITYCQYGDDRMKPTDLWGRFPSTLKLKEPCKNGDPCHSRAPRGSRSGTQGMKNAVERAVVPEQLCEDIRLACEEDIELDMLSQKYGF